jgi:hypothetical protein
MLVRESPSLGSNGSPSNFSRYRAASLRWAIPIAAPTPLPTRAILHDFVVRWGRPGAVLEMLDSSTEYLQEW